MRLWKKKEKICNVITLKVKSVHYNPTSHVIKFNKFNEYLWWLQHLPYKRTFSFLTKDDIHYYIEGDIVWMFEKNEEKDNKITG